MIKKILNNKPFYIVLLVIALITVTGSLLIRFAVPEFGNVSGSVQEFSSDGIPSMPDNIQGDFDRDTSDSEASGEDSKDASSGPSFNPGSMPGRAGDDSDSGDGIGSMPSFDSSEIPSFDSSDMPSVPDFGNSDSTDTNTAAAGQSVGSMSTLQKIRKVWLFIFLPSLMITVVCIVRLIMISRRRKKEKQAEKDAALEGLDENEILRLRAKEEAELVLQKRGRKKTKNIILAGILVIVIVFVTVAGRMLTGTTALSTGTQVDEEILSDSIAASDIQSVIKGAGTVSSDESVSVTIPGDVTIISWLKTNGDTVKSGDVVAMVDTDSAAAAIADLQTLIAELDEDIETAGADTVSEDITASAGGRIMAVYAAEGDDAADVTQVYGALAVLSLDGKLAVDLELTGSIAVGSEVTVTFSDGSTCTGKVSARDQESMTVTVSDENNAAGDNVTVSDTEGNILGSGTLYIHSAQNITAFTGTVKTVEVTEGSTVSAGDTMFTLDDCDYSVIRDELLSKRSTLEEQMRELILAYTSGYITADADGVLSGIDTEAAGTEDEVTASDMAAYSDASAVWSENGVVYMRDGADISAVKCDTVESGPAENPSESSNEENGEEPSGGEESPSADPEEESSPQESKAEEPSGSAEKPDESTAAAEESQAAENIPVSGNDQKPSEQETAADPVGESSGTEADLLKKELIAKIDTLDYETLMKIYQLIREAESGIGSADASQGKTGENQPSVSGQEEMPTGSQSGIPSSSGTSGSDENSFPGMTGSVDMSGFDMSGLTENASETSEDDEEEEEIDVSKYEFSETTLCSITPDSEMSVEISVDEKDVAFVSEGMTVTVSLDAFPGQSFEGTVTDIDTEDYVNNGGSTKYTVTVVISRSKNILTGMNASVIIPKEDRKAVLSIPLNAVCEEGSRVYVYTSYDEKTDTLGDPVEITTGISDGENVEVLSGLSEGDTYYYRYAGTIIYNFLSSLTM